jgi:hypothetical protein
MGFLRQESRLSMVVLGGGVKLNFGWFRVAYVHRLKLQMRFPDYGSETDHDESGFPQRLQKRAENSFCGAPHD